MIELTAALLGRVKNESAQQNRF